MRWWQRTHESNHPRRESTPPFGGVPRWECGGGGPRVSPVAIVPAGTPRHSAGLHPARQRRGGLQVASGVPPDATLFVSRRQAPISSSVGTSIDSHGWNPWASPRARQFTERRRMAVWIHAKGCSTRRLVTPITQTTHAYPPRNPASVRGGFGVGLPTNHPYSRQSIVPPGLSARGGFTPSPAPSQTFSTFFHFLPCIRPFPRLRGYGKRTCLSRDNPI